MMNKISGDGPALTGGQGKQQRTTRKSNSSEKNKLVAGDEPATEEFALEVAQLIEKDIGVNARRMFHDLGN